MTVGRFLAFLLGAACLVGLTVYAGAGAVLKSLVAIKFTGLLLVAAVHLPIVAFMGWAWWQIGHDFPGATRLKFAWGRLVRDSAAEVLPFSQLGGFVLGVRALHLSGVHALRSALAMSVDLVMELWAKLPYFLTGLVTLLFLAPDSRLSEGLPVALALTAAGVAIPLLFRNQLRRALEVSAVAIARRWPNLNTHDEMRLFFDRIYTEPRRLIAAFTIHLGCWFAGALETWLILKLMGLQVGLPQALVIDSLVVGLRTFGFLVPAAAGVQEASYVLVCAVFGLSPATAIAVSLARRARDLIIGVPTLAAWQYIEAQTAGTPTTIDS